MDYHYIFTDMYGSLKMKPIDFDDHLTFPKQPFPAVFATNSNQAY